MVVVSVSVPAEELQEFDEVSKSVGFTSRSDAMREAIRNFVSDKKTIAETKGRISCVVTILYADKKKHHVHDVIHEYSNIVHSSMHTHVNGQCVEQIVLDGLSKDIKRLFSSLSAQKDVRMSVNLF